MASVLGLTGLLKRLLKIQSLDDEDERKFELDVDNNYISILNSSKYAESNSNTEALEKMVKAMSLENELIKNDELEVTSLDQDLGHKLKIEEGPRLPGKPVEPGLAAAETRREENFRDRLGKHMDLLKDLEKENFLPGQPVFEKEKFGKNGAATRRLGFFPIPNIVYDSMAINDITPLHLETPIAPENYANRFQTILWIEEAHQAIEMHRYDIYGAMLGKHDDGNLILPVPGLAEGRPSLMRGDRVLLKSEKRQTKYEGFISDVREKDILIRLHESLHSSDLDGLRFDVNFLMSRTPFRRCHQGIELISNSSLFKKILFPTTPTNLQPVAPKLNLVETDPQSLRCFSSELNQHQRRAVISILRSTCRPSPYIIFGPPGTGKTVTVVEAVLQVYARMPGSRILVCGNSNACADLLASRIQRFSTVVPKDKLLRLSAMYRMEKLVPAELEGITKDMMMLSPALYSEYRIVVTTCIQAGALNQFSESFDYVFIDEAGHANEPECLIPIGLINKEGAVVLAGDPHQLGPVCISHVAAAAGLGSSLLERLFRRSVYQKRIINLKMSFNPDYITKLVVSYRSDPRVMTVCNKMFYENELECKNQTPQKWLDLLDVKKPLVFHYKEGRDRREITNPSWFNANEAITVLTYVNRLYKSGLKPEQLGIVTPYRKQIEKLNLLFDSCYLKKCKIATMEEFQGDEREVIIISTVRTREKNLEIDRKFRLGFLFDPKRFNVAISRAKWLVIVVGDEKILKRDDCWVEYISNAHRIEDLKKE